MIGLDDDYRNDHQAKKDVIDPSGDAHSVKSGQKKWQIFLYGANRIKTDPQFLVMDGIGQILASCIDAFPESFEEYQKNKVQSKECLRKSMVSLANKLNDKNRLRAFLSKSIFNGGEVNYLTVYDSNKFHVFWGKEVVEVMAENLEVTNSLGRRIGEISEQKVLLRYDGNNLAEIEMRNDSLVHYREIRFNMYKRKAMNLLYSKIPLKINFNESVILYGLAIKRFGNWIIAE